MTIFSLPNKNTNIMIYQVFRYCKFFAIKFSFQLAEIVAETELNDAVFPQAEIIVDPDDEMVEYLDPHHFPTFHHPAGKDQIGFRRIGVPGG